MDHATHTPGHRYTALAHELATNDDLVDTLRATHVRSPTGHCAARQCGAPGYGTPVFVHPCPARILADLARSLRRNATPGVLADPPASSQRH